MDIDFKIDSEEQISEYQTSVSEHFTINSNKAAEILGINRTRLSQLTSKGLFPYERRKVQSRSRLFYRLNDLLNYQRKSSFGNLQITENSTTLVPLLPSGSLDQATQTLTKIKEPPLFTKQIKNIQPIKKRELKTALAVKANQNIQEKTKNLENKLDLFDVKFKNGLNALETKLEQILDQLESTCLLYEKKQKSLRVKKSMLKSPSMKRAFKIVKRRNFK